MKKLTPFLLVSSCLLFTGSLINAQGKNKIVEIDEDTLTAIVQQKSDNKVVFVGEKYRYVVDGKWGKELNADLDKYRKDNSKVYIVAGGSKNSRVIADKNSIYQDGLWIRVDFTKQKCSISLNLRIADPKYPHSEHGHTKFLPCTVDKNFQTKTTVHSLQNALKQNVHICISNVSYHKRKIEYKNGDKCLELNKW